MKRKGIILAGGLGTRLYPATLAVSKQLLAVYDKPMIYYPLSTLMLAGIREILIISTPRDTPVFEGLLGTGEDWGVEFAYAAQDRPGGLAQALIIAEGFLNGGHSALILGDNIFYGHEMISLMLEASSRTEGATVFAYRVNEPERYGVVEFGPGGRAVDLAEKPERPRSSYAVTGLYFYDPQAPALAHSLKPSGRGELEITDLNRLYLSQGLLSVQVMGRGYAWLDTGTHESLLEAGQFIQTIEKRQGLKISCPEEAAFRNGWIDAGRLRALGERLGGNGYGKYLCSIAEEG
ncbi:MAG: glucose-1-phosphate thymidylyltransferase RfbA [Deltaproteobacteria bacterium]|jgi:glucose-1-phosphate thymidylyltransferase|nr:glucose-1-phosphate thymidylyltransferase RfbA [Deltaproteobacteria bacterium]